MYNKQKIIEALVHLYEKNPARFPTIMECHNNGITIEVCHGEIPDILRQYGFSYSPHLRITWGHVREFELPDTKVSDEEFREWLELYRHAAPWLEYPLLEDAQCN